jgi:hypothetical protein
MRRPCHSADKRNVSLRPPFRQAFPAALVSLLAGVLGVTAWQHDLTAQHTAAGVRTVVPSHVTIPYLANASRPTDLDYAAAECDITPDGLTMTCRFRQLFLTPVSFDATSCAITSNGFERTFSRADTSARRWSSTDSPQGACGLVETHTLDDGGGTRWTLTITTRRTKTGGNLGCQPSPDDAVVYDWRSMKRLLPCSHVQPAMIER